MERHGVNQLRQMYLDFFESKGHLKMKSFSLIPQNDKSLLLIGSGMAPLKPYFTGQEIPPRNRVTTCQKCIRTVDIENVGKTSRHGTFFEMLGNFSFGDYFKEESLAWSWEFLTEVLGIDADRLYPSIYQDDDEAYKIWNEQIGIPHEKIFRMGKEDNFWEHGAGPCGPSSEIYYDRGEAYGCGSEDCTVGCDCDRYMEVWNNVFTQFDGDGAGNYTELANKNIDTGMGLERLAIVVQEAESFFDIDTMKVLRNKICEMSKTEYNVSNKKDISIRIITDHIRSVTFMIADGVIPSNEGRGYVLRRLLRRAARHGRLLGIEGKFLATLSSTVIEESKDGYSELEEKKEYILKLLTIEEDRFNETIDQGLNILGEMEDVMLKNGAKTLSGEDAFKLYDTYGFPLDLTKEILEEKGYTVDEESFNKAMNIQKETARQARETTNYMGADVTVYQQLDNSITSEFVGYNDLNTSSVITALTTEDSLTSELIAGQKGTVFTKQTPFYATSGGQVADTGLIKSDTSEFMIEDTIKLQGGKIGHVGTVISGILKVSDKVILEINEDKRTAICKNHSATHLLQKALRMVLGSHVEQAGSNVSSDRLRFDFTHFSALTKEELQKVEGIVNDQIKAGISVETNIMNIEEAKKSGAMALFGEKYANDVRVVTMEDFSKELCGGTHVKNTSSILVFKILSETGIAAGVRRIEALTADGVLNYYKDIESELFNISKAAKSEPSLLAKKFETMQEEIKLLQSENASLKNKLAKGSLGDIMNNIIEVKGTKLLASQVTDIDMNGLRELGDQLKDKLGEGVIVLASATSTDKVNLLAMASDQAIKSGAHAGNLIKEIAVLVGGGGGGRPGMAQAGGKNPNGINEAIQKAEQVLKNQIKD